MDLNGALHEFSKAHCPSDKQQLNYNEAIEKIGKILHQSSTYKFQLLPAGSFAKKSGIAGRMDLDVIVFLNNEKPPFDKVISQLKEVLKENSKLTEKDIADSSFSLQFSWPCGADEDVDIDLVMAANLVPTVTKHRDVRLPKQHSQVMQEIKKWKNRKGELDPSEGGRFYSSSLTEPVIEFVRAQSASTHELIRLLKLWKNSIYFSRKISGLSSLMEIIGSYIGMSLTEECGNDYSMLDALERFFQLVKDLKTTNIVFSEESMQKFAKTPINPLYKDADIPQSLRSTRPLLLDTANPYNNRLQGPSFTNDVFSILSHKADASLALIKNARQFPKSRTGTELFELVMKIVFPGPFLFAPAKLETMVLIPIPRFYMTSRNENVTKPTLQTFSGTAIQESYAKFCLKLLDLLVKSKQRVDNRPDKAMPTPSACQNVKSFLERATNSKMDAPKAKENEYNHVLKIPCGSGTILIVYFQW